LYHSVDILSYVLDGNTYIKKKIGLSFVPPCPVDNRCILYIYLYIRSWINEAVNDYEWM